MKRSFVTKTTMIAVVIAILVTGCQPAVPATVPVTATAAPTAAPTTEQPTAAPATQAPTTSAPQASFVYISPNPIGVDAFLQLGQTGLEVAGKKWNAKTQVMEATDPTSRQEDVQAAVNNNATIVIVFGFEFNDIITSIAPTAPNTKFLIVDQCISNPPANVYCATSLEYEAAFLIGVEAAMLTKTNHIGVIGAQDIPFLHRHTVGFTEGAKYINPNVTVDVLWIGGNNPFSDPVRAKQQALVMASAGVDQIFAAASGSNLGIFEAAQEKGFDAYGADINQCTLQPGFVVDNLLKHADVEMEQSIDAIMQNTSTKSMVYGLKSGGIGLIAQQAGDLTSTKCLVANHPDVIQKVNEVAQKIIDGTITLQDPSLQK